MTQHKNFVAVRTAYYKTTAGKKEIAHSLRVGEHAKNENVKFPEDQHMNIITFDENSFDEIQKKHAEDLGKAPRQDRNSIFEHILIFSEENFTKQGNPNHHVKLAERYAEKIKEEFGFEPIGIALHLDEGRICEETGRKIKNTHAHVYFYNYDFEKKKAPLRDLMIKGKNENGQTNKLNPNFQKMQDIAAESFKPLGYKRGVSSDKKHLNKNDFVLQEQAKKIGKYNKAIKRLNTDAKELIEVLKGDLSEYIENTLKEAKKEVLEAKSDNVIETFLNLPKQAQKSLVSEIIGLTDKLSDNLLNKKVKDLNIKPSSERKRRRRKPKPE